MKTRNIVIIGNGKIAVDCAQIILRTIQESAKDWRLAFVAIDCSRNAQLTEALELFCAKTGLPCERVANVNTSNFVERMRILAPELIFSINNFQVIREDLLAVPRQGIINFHNAPLPKYAGSNACTWAIYHGEVTHGVTWHYVDTGIDSGDIVAQKSFEIPQNCTAIRLIMTCLVEGTRLFETALPTILRGEESRSPQDVTARSYFPMRAVPNAGAMSLEWDFATLSRFVRSLHFYPFCNDLAFPTLAYEGRFFRVDEITLVAREKRGKLGEVLEITDRSCHFQCGDAVVSLVKFRDLPGRALKFQDLSQSYELSPGALLIGTEGSVQLQHCSSTK